MKMMFRFCLIALSVATLAAQLGRPPKEITFTIVDTQNGDYGGGEGWTSNATSTYRLCSSWGFSYPPEDLIPVLTEAGLTVEDLKASGSTPRDMWAKRGSLLALRPGERLQFYLAELSGTSTEKKSNEHGSVSTIGDGVFEHRTSKSKWTDRSQEGTPESANPAAEFIRTAKGGILYFSQGRVPAAGLTDFMGTVTIVQGSSGWRSVFVFTITNEELGKWENINKSNHGVVTNPEGQSIDYLANLSVTQPVSATEVEVSVDETVYPSWRPEGNIDAPGKPGNSLTVKIAARAPGDPSKPRRVKLSLTLPYDSEQKGVCINYPANAAKNVGLRFRKEDFADDGPLEFIDEKTVRTRGDERVERAAVTVYAYDFGAWGTLRVSAKDEAGNDAKVMVRGKAVPDLSIPRDDNGNRIADGWEVTGVPADRSWDGETVAGQDKAGDGLTLFNEYRGVVALDGSGKREHRRLEPRAKEMFVVDLKAKFPLDLWQRVSNTTAIRLDDSLVDASSGLGDAPLVDFNAEDRDAHPVFAVKVMVIDGDTDPSPPTGKDGKPDPATTTDPSFPAMAYAFQDGSIRGTEYVKVFPDRARIFLNHYLQWLDMGLKDPSSVPGTELRDPANKFTVDEAFRAWTRLQDPKEQAKVIQRLVNVFFLHELGHVCGGLPDHLDNEAPNEEARQCLMFNRSKYGHRRMIVLTALDRGDSDFAFPYHDFCRNVGVAGYHCYGSLNVKDW
jgi:hypothetical protein